MPYGHPRGPLAITNAALHAAALQDHRRSHQQGAQHHQRRGQYRRVGRWRDYLYGERVYMLLSLVAKSLLAWQVFAGTLQPA